MLLARAVRAVGQKLEEEVTALFKKMLRLRYESPEEIGRAVEWTEMDYAFRLACEAYASIAMSNREQVTDDTYDWVKERIEANQDAICVHHFGCHRGGGLVNVKGDAWRAIFHVGWMNLSAVWWECSSKIERGVTLALENAAIKLAAGKIGGHSGPYDNGWQLSDHATSLQPIILSGFEIKVGSLMVKARHDCATKYLPRNEISKIAEALDKEKYPARVNLERESSRRMAQFNQAHPNVAIKTWTAALNHPQFRGAVRKRLSRAEEKYKRAKHA